MRRRGCGLRSVLPAGPRWCQGAAAGVSRTTRWRGDGGAGDGVEQFDGAAGRPEPLHPLVPLQTWGVIPQGACSVCVMVDIPRLVSTPYREGVTAGLGLHRIRMAVARLTRYIGSPPTAGDWTGQPSRYIAGVDPESRVAVRQYPVSTMVRKALQGNGFHRCFTFCRQPGPEGTEPLREGPVSGVGIA